MRGPIGKGQVPKKSSKRIITILREHFYRHISVGQVNGLFGVRIRDSDPWVSNTLDPNDSWLPQMEGCYEPGLLESRTIEVIW